MDLVTQSHRGWTSLWLLSLALWHWRAQLQWLSMRWPSSSPQPTFYWLTDPRWLCYLRIGAVRLASVCTTSRYASLPVHITATMCILLADSLPCQVASLVCLTFHVWVAGFTPPVSLTVLWKALLCSCCGAPALSISLCFCVLCFPTLFTAAHIYFASPQHLLVQRSILCTP